MEYNRAKEKMRKNLFLCLAIAVAMVIMPSCKKDKDTASLIIGTWEVTESTISDVSNYNVGKTFEFKKDGSFSGWLFNGDFDFVNCKYAINDNTHSLNMSDFDIQANVNIDFTINEITADKLDISGNYSIKNYIPDPGEDPENYNGSMSFKLKKK